MKAYKRLIPLLLSAGLIGCSSTTSVQRADQSESGFDPVLYNGSTTILREDVPDSDAYRVFQKGGSGFVTLNNVRAKAEKRADEFCARKSQVVELVRTTTSVAPHLLGNFPRVEIVFTCILIESEAPIAKEASSVDYDQLRELKSLLDEGVITQDEYNREKGEILSR
jgi:hypothetical protein